MIPRFRHADGRVDTVAQFTAMLDDTIFLTQFGLPIRMSPDYRSIDETLNWPKSALPCLIIGRVLEEGSPE